jgi:hypothetical protein
MPRHSLDFPVTWPHVALGPGTFHSAPRAEGGRQLSWGRLFSLKTISAFPGRPLAAPSSDRGVLPRTP